MAQIALNKPSGGQLLIQPEDGTSTETVTIPSVGVGKVLQIAQGSNASGYSSPSVGVWVPTFTFSIDNVKEGSSLYIDMAPAGLMEHSGAVLYSVFDNEGYEIGRTGHNGTGNGGWRTAPVTIMCKDPSPVVGTNTYTLKFYSTGPHMYINYLYPSHNMVTWWKITEVAA